MATRKTTKRVHKSVSGLKKSVQFVGDNKPAETASNDLDGMTSQIRNLLNVQQQQRDILQKSVKPQTIRKDIEQKYDKSKVVFSSREYQGGYEGVETKSWRRLSDQELRELSQIDPYISAIISTRCNQGSICGRPSESKFDKGTRIRENQPLRLEDFETRDQFEKAQEQRKNQMKAILKWMMTCGDNDEALLDTVFSEADRTFKNCNLPDFVTAQIRNLLTFGRCGSQIFRNEEGIPVLFRPVPIETIYNLADDQDAYIGTGRETLKPSIEDAQEFNKMPQEERPYAYIQRVEGRNVNFFTERDLTVWHFQKQALFDLRGYPLAPIEQAVYMVYIHQQTLGYLRNQFMKGIGSKGILTLESTDPAASLSDEDLDTLRREFHNFVTRNDNSAVTPVISGPVKVGFVQLNPTPRDMEWLQVEEHIVRALCSAMQISPHEMGYGHLSIGQGGLSQANKQDEITQGEERGLRMVLDIIYDGLNEILYENFPEARELFRLTYTGVGEDTRDAVVLRHTQELQTTATMSSLYSDSEKSEPVPYGGDVPLSPLFHANVSRYMLYGRFMEDFFGETGASKKPEYDFIIDPALNEAYQKLKAVPPEMDHMQAELGIEQQAAELQAMQAQTQMAGMQQEAAPQEGGATPESTPEEAPPEESQEAQKSLADAYREKQKLQKSMSFYFKEWIDAHGEQG